MQDCHSKTEQSLERISATKFVPSVKPRQVNCRKVLWHSASDSQFARPLSEQLLLPAGTQLTELSFAFYILSHCIRRILWPSFKQLDHGYDDMTLVLSCFDLMNLMNLMIYVSCISQL